MGKASKWFRAVLGLRKAEPPPPPSGPTPTTSSRDNKPKRWSFVKSYREKTTKRAVPTSTTSFQEPEHPSKHAVAVAAATAAAAEVAVAAAHAAAEVVRLTSSGRSASSRPAKYVASASPEVAAVRIQSAFRGYLARRALKALRALVKLQALVRGHIERKRTAEWLQRMQALLRAQARARAGRVQISESSLSNSSSKSSHFHHPGPPTPEKFEHAIRTRSGKYDQSFMLKRTVSKSNNMATGEQGIAHSFSGYSERRPDDRSWDQRLPSRRNGPPDEDKSDKILEIDSGKALSTYERGKLFHPAHHHYPLPSDQYTHSSLTSKDTITHQSVFSPSSGEVQSPSPLKFSNEVEEAFCTADNSPQYYSASSRGGSSRRSPFTPTKSDGSRSFLGGYSDHPNYMSTTESSKAKVRSLSAPRQGPQYERSSSTKRYSIHAFGEPQSSNAQRASALRVNFASKAYPGSGRLDSLGMPIGQRY